MASRTRLVQFEESLLGSDYSGAESELIRAVDRYKRETGTLFPSVIEIIRIARGLGWVRDPAQAMDRDPVIGDFVEAPVRDWDSAEDGDGKHLRPNQRVAPKRLGKRRKNPGG